MEKLTIEIPQAHWEAIEERRRIMQALVAQFQILRAEDQRHSDAVIRTLGHSPQDWEQYDLQRRSGQYQMVLTPKAQDPQLQAGAGGAPVNGVPQPQVEVAAAQ